MAIPKTDLPVSYEDSTEAAELLSGVVVQTPLLESSALNKQVGGRLLFKAETLQITGSFKFRGAYNHISRLDASIKQNGVVAYSSGNHAQGTAAAAHYCETPAVIVMPKDAPEVKKQGTARWGAEIGNYDRYGRKTREEIAGQIAEDHGLTIVKPYDDRFIMAGQGTAGLEIMQQLSERKLQANRVLVPCGGGGLTAGIATAIKYNDPNTIIQTVEPEGFDDTARSLKLDARQQADLNIMSFCDALLAPEPGQLTFEVNRRLCGPGLVVKDAEVATAMAAAFQHLKLVLEPGGAVGLAAALSGKVTLDGITVILLSGGNVDPLVFADILKDGK